MLVDTHAHLNAAEFDEDRTIVIERAVKSGVERMVDVATDLHTALKALQTAESYESVRATVGIHPHDAAKAKESDFIELERLLSHPRAAALGEIGLDYHYEFSPRHVQKDVFLRQLRIAVLQEKPVIIHVREAMADVLAVLKSFPIPKWEGVFHCFNGTAGDVGAVLDLGFHVSFTGVVTFPNFKKLDVVRRVPLDRLLVETDAPYMTPVPHRGKRNEPAFLVHTAQRLAVLYALTPERFSEQTTLNALRLFRWEK